MSEDVQKEIFSRNLKAYIANSGKTQLEIAKSIDVSPQTFNTWCQGIAIPRMGKVQALAQKSTLLQHTLRVRNFQKQKWKKLKTLLNL